MSIVAYTAALDFSQPPPLRQRNSVHGHQGRGNRSRQWRNWNDAECNGAPWNLLHLAAAEPGIYDWFFVQRFSPRCIPANQRAEYGTEAAAAAAAAAVAVHKTIDCR